MTRLRSLIKEVLSTPPKKKDCNCGCGGCDKKSPIITEGRIKKAISEGLTYHVENKIPLHESVYRIGSEKHFALINEARKLWVRGLIDVSEDDQAILETHLGNFGMYEGEEVPLDMPMVDEELEKDYIEHLQNIRNDFYNKGDKEKAAEVQADIDKLLGESLNENNLLKQTNLSSEEYQKAKKLKGFNADDYTFISDNNLYVKKSSLDEAKYRVEYTTQDGEKAKSRVYNSEEEADKKEEDLVNSGIKQAKVVKVEESINEAMVDYDFSKEELIRVIKQLKRGASTEVGMIKAFEKALGRELTDDEIRGFKLNEAKKKSKKKDPPLNKPERGGSKAYFVYVRDPKTKKIKKVSFGSGGLRAKIKNKQARNAFAARHNCKNKKDRTTAGYWSCNLPRYADQLGLGSNMNTFW